MAGQGVPDDQNRPRVTSRDLAAGYVRITWLSVIHAFAASKLAELRLYRLYHHALEFPIYPIHS